MGNRALWRSGTFATVAVWAIVVLSSARAGAESGLLGYADPAFANLDQVVEQFRVNRMDDGGGAVAVSRNGCIVYQRGFGGVSENAPMRIASLTKLFTYAIVRQLVDEGLLYMSDFVFDLGQPNQWVAEEKRWRQGGILAYTPHGVLGDDRVADITVQHLLDHQGGWYKNESGDPTYETREIADDLGVSSPAGRDNTVKWVLGKRLDYTPGTGCGDKDANSEYLPGCGNGYSNFGYMVLGLIIEQKTGKSFTDNIHARIFDADDWVPATDFASGRSLPPDRDPREPDYKGGDLAYSVFDASRTVHDLYAFPAIHHEPNGGFHLEARVGHGNLVSTAAPLIRFAEKYVLGGENIGMRRADKPLADTDPIWTPQGSLAGTSTAVAQKWDGINVVVLMNERSESDYWAGELVDQIYASLASNPPSWPSRCIDGYWVRFGTSWSMRGSYDQPFTTVNEMVQRTVDGAKFQLYPNTSTTWTGTITQRMLITAPLGPAKIGAQ